MLHWSRRAALALLAASLCSCVAGPNFVAPADTAARPQSDSDSPWWAALNSPQLDATIREALAHNRDLAAARATLGQMQELAAASEGARYPQAELDASAGRQKYGAAFLGPERLPPFSFYSVGVSVSYMFDFAGGVRRTIERQNALATYQPVSYTHLRAHETGRNLVCRLL